MASLESYLRGQFQDDKQQIRIIDEIVDEVVPTFGCNFGKSDGDQGNTWPYDVSAGSSDSPKFSFSTHAMISFALDALTQRPFNSTLISDKIVPRKLGLNKEDREKLLNILRTAKRVLIEKLSQSEQPIVQSGTYGNNDPLTLTWLAELAYRCNADEDDVDLSALDRCKDGIIAAAKEVFKRAPDSILSLNNATENPHYEIQHSFLKLRCLHLEKAAGYLSHSKLKPSKTKLDRASLDTAVHRQLGYSVIPDSRFDPAELVFATEAVLQVDRYGLNQSTIKRIFAILAKSQEDTPYWRPVTPFLSTKQGMVLFPVSVEIVNSLLRICGILDEHHRPTYFSLIEPLLRRYADWIISRIERFEGENGHVSGWISEHVNERGRIHLWETSQVLLFLAHYAGMLQNKIAADGLVEAGLTLRDLQSLNPIQGFWDDEPLSKLGENYEVLSTIRNSFINSRKQPSGNKPENSLLLYGPPGTGKTTVAEQMVIELQWPLLTITVSDFLADGAAEVEARAKGVFQVLQEQREIVILFDEIDQFLLDRNSEGYKNQTGIFQFMTPGMLTKFQDLRDAAQSVFIVATNYEERIDSAIKRKGRFDSRFFLSLPDRKRRLAFLWQFLCKRLPNLIKEEEWKDAQNNDADSKIEKNLLAELEKKTVLFGFGDLKHLVERELKINVDDTLDGVVKQLGNIAEDVHPAVKLSAYTNRFNVVGEQQYPFEEFAVLLYLVGEGGSKIESEDRLALERANEILKDSNKTGKIASYILCAAEEKENVLETILGAAFGSS